MQYKEGKSVRKSIVKNWQNSDSLIFTPSVNNPDASVAERDDIRKSQIKATPDFRILIPWLVVNSNFSLSKVRWELCFVNTTALINANQNIILPKGCGIINPEDNPINRITANMRFQKLSLLSLEAIKPVCVVTEFCSSIVLLCFSVVQNVVKSSMKTYYDYWFKSYNFIISKLHHVLKSIMQVIVVFFTMFAKDVQGDNRI